MSTSAAALEESKFGSTNQADAQNTAPPYNAGDVIHTNGQVTDEDSLPEMKQTEVLDAYGNEEGAEVQCAYICSVPTDGSKPNVYPSHRQDHDMDTRSFGDDCREHLPRYPVTAGCVG